MKLSDLKVTKPYSPYCNQFVVDVVFRHANDDIDQHELVVFPKESTKADVIEFINFLDDANSYTMHYCQEPSGVYGYDKWCNRSKPGLSGWPADHNRNYFSEVAYVTVTYYDETGTRFNVEQVKA